MKTNQAYKEVNGTSYHVETSQEVINVLERCRNSRTRIVVGYGKDGISWGETFDIRGYVGRSTGVTKIPLLVYNSRSLGGGHLLDNVRQKHR